MAKLDLSMAEVLFEEEVGRKPYATERKTMEEMTMSASYVAGKDQFIKFWCEMNGVHDTGMVVQDEFSMMGCLDRDN